MKAVYGMLKAWVKSSPFWCDHDILMLLWRIFDIKHFSYKTLWPEQQPILFHLLEMIREWLYVKCYWLHRLIYQRGHLRLLCSLAYLIKVTQNIAEDDVDNNTTTGTLIFFLQKENLWGIEEKQNPKNISIPCFFSPFKRKTRSTE